MIGFFSLIKHVGSGRCVPDVTDTERRVEVKTNQPLVVYVDGLIDKIESVRRLVRQLYCCFIAILEIEGRNIFLLQNVIKLRIVLYIGL